MTPEESKLVKTSWLKIAPISETAAELFYGKLFELNPELKKLFTTDMTIQGRKLMATLYLAVNSLDNLEAIIPELESSGRRHAGYGVEEKDYDTVATALLWTLERGLGDDFTPEVRAAWIAVYSLLANTMKGAVSKAA